MVVSATSSGTDVNGLRLNNRQLAWGNSTRRVLRVVTQHGAYYWVRRGLLMHSNDAQMLVLTVLADGPRHGYAINTAIQELTGARLGPGSLYGALARLEARNLIESAGEPAHPKDRQRTVRITQTGRQVLRVQLEQMARVSQAGLRALGGVTTA